MIYEQHCHKIDKREKKSQLTQENYTSSDVEVVKHAQMGRSQSDCRKKSRDGLSTNQIAGFGGVVKQDGGPETGHVTRPARGHVVSK